MLKSSGFCPSYCPMRAGRIGRQGEALSRAGPGHGSLKEVPGNTGEEKKESKLSLQATWLLEFPPGWQCEGSVCSQAVELRALQVGYWAGEPPLCWASGPGGRQVVLAPGLHSPTPPPLADFKIQLACKVSRTKAGFIF